ncbi:MAG: hypothetical protein LBT87_10685, partial [Treponema sp.]|jgi:hypothetical protein|nr:hypothetical protein [Treponema sp.]
VDTYPGKPGEEDSNKTLAHEMQHLMNFVTSTQIRVNEEKKLIYLMDTWIDEGLSGAAEYIYLNSHTLERYGWFNSDPEGTIARGNNFFVWGNLQDNSVLDDYATAYLFFQWLRLQSGDTRIYKNIIKSPYSDYRAVTGAIKPHLDASLMSNDSDWTGLLKTWMAANYINAPSGPYGYRGEPRLSDVKAKTAPAGTTVLSLLPGEGVYSITRTGGATSVYASGSGANIRYAGVNSAGTGFVSDTSTFLGGALLTYNASINTNGTREPGKLTGVTGASGRGVSQARSAGHTAREGPFRIDARDMKARNGLPGEGVDRVLPLGAKALAGEVRGE